MMLLNYWCINDFNHVVFLADVFDLFFNLWLEFTPWFANFYSNLFDRWVSSVLIWGLWHIIQETFRFTIGMLFATIVNIDMVYYIASFIIHNNTFHRYRDYKWFNLYTTEIFLTSIMSKRRWNNVEITSIAYTEFLNHVALFWSLSNVNNVNKTSKQC